MDHAWVVDLVRKAGHLALVKPYLLAVQPADLTAVNDAINNLLIEEEDFEGLKTSIDTYDNSPPRGGVVWPAACSGPKRRWPAIPIHPLARDPAGPISGRSAPPAPAPQAASRQPPPQPTSDATDRESVRPTAVVAGWGPEELADRHLHRSSLSPVPPPPLQTSRLSDGGALRSARLASSG